MMRQAYSSSSYRAYHGNAEPANDGDINHDRWLVSYADFMTLLMAFFVVMYSISQISEQKYRVLSETFNQAFNPSNQIEQILREGEPQQSYTLTPIDMEGTALEDRPGNDVNDVPETFVRIEEQLQERFQSLIESEVITVTGDERWLQIELQSAILFDSGGAKLNEMAAAIIGELSAAMAEHNNVIQVEGFTDDIPISTPIFDSNWELSAARATAVVKQMVEQGIAPQRLAAIGYGEHQPVATNRTEEGRARNRRIVLMVSTKEQLRPDALQIEEFVLDTDGVIKLDENGAVTQIVGTSAREQAEAWFARLTNQQQLVSAQPLAPDITETETSVDENVESTETVANETVDQGSTENNNEVVPVEGIKQVELDNGALLFTSGDE